MALSSVGAIEHSLLIWLEILELTKMRFRNHKNFVATLCHCLVRHFLLVHISLGEVSKLIMIRFLVFSFALSECLFWVSLILPLKQHFLIY